MSEIAKISVTLKLIPMHYHILGVKICVRFLLQKTTEWVKGDSVHISVQLLKFLMKAMCTCVVVFADFIYWKAFSDTYIMHLQIKHIELTKLVHLFYPVALQATLLNCQLPKNIHGCLGPLGEHLFYT